MNIIVCIFIYIFVYIYICVIFELNLYILIRFFSHSISSRMGNPYLGKWKLFAEIKFGTN